MVDGYYSAVTQAITKAGFKYAGNAEGSHEKWQHRETGRVVLVPRNLKSRHTANAIAKDAGLGKLF